eukprot:scaffold269085_cov30-Tisochrysis_lutea.AAC.2
MHRARRLPRGWMIARHVANTLEEYVCTTFDPCCPHTLRRVALPLLSAMWLLWNLYRDCGPAHHRLTLSSRLQRCIHLRRRGNHTLRPIRDHLRALLGVDADVDVAGGRLREPLCRVHCERHLVEAIARRLLVSPPMVLNGAAKLGLQAPSALQRL